MKNALAILALAIASFAQPTAQLPQKQVDTSWVTSTGVAWPAHTVAQLRSALVASQPGDVIVLDAGVTYTGYFQLPAKPNTGQWITILTGNFVQKHPQDVRVSPADAVDMARVQTPNVAADFQVNPGANHWRFVGLELTSASSYNPNKTKWPGMGYAYFLIGSQSHPNPLPDSIIVDRCYIHGSPTQDIVTAVQGNASNYAVIDSYISEIHAPGQDSQAFGAYDTPGPVKLVNNYLEAAGENILFGGSGGNANHHPADITVTGNYLFKRTAWACNTGKGCTVGNSNQWVEKNGFELKDARQVLFDTNTIENVWAGGQLGYAIVLTVRTGQSGDAAVVEDVTITNNTLKNVVAGFNTGAKDYQCGVKGGTPNCLNAGTSDRWVIKNNALVSFWDSSLPGANRNLLLAMNPGQDTVNHTPAVLQNIDFSGNSMPKGCWQSVYFSGGAVKPPYTGANIVTSNVWMTGNTFCKQPSGDNGRAVSEYMNDPSSPSFSQRYAGNQILP